MSGSIQNSIAFPYYPASNRTYGVFADVDGSKANTATTQQRSLLIGQMLAAGVAAPTKPVLVTGLAQAATLFGFGSMLYEMVRQYRVEDSFGELWALPLADPAGAQALGGLVFTPIGGQALGTGTVALYVAGVSIPVPVIAGDTGITIAARAAAAINAAPDCSCTGSSANNNSVSVQSIHAGLLGNDIDLRANYLGALGGEGNVPGLTVGFAPMAGGAGVPALSAALANLGDVTYDFIATPYVDTASLTALDQFLNFSTGRWSWQSMLYGGYFAAARGTPGSLVSLGTARNGPNGSILGVYDTPDPMWVVAASYCGACAASLRQDPNTPLQNLVMNIHAPPRTSAFVRSIRNTMLYDGISTWTVNRAGQFLIERAITSYQLNPAGNPDNAFLDVETMYGLAKLIRDWKAEMLRLYPREKLLQDGNAIPAGSNATTAAQIRLATIAWYRLECDNGNAQNPDAFAAAVLAQNAGNGLVKELLPFFLPNQLRQLAGDVTFTKP